MVALGCARCGLEERGPALCSEDFAGPFQAACYHSACAECWRACVEGQLPRCSAERLLRVFCPAPGCGRCVAQKLVLRVSPAARNLAMEIDRDNDRLDLAVGVRVHWQIRGSCPVCQEPCGPLLLNNSCDHGACQECWLQWAKTQVPRCRSERQMRFSCLGPACVETMAQPLVQQLTMAEPELKSLQRDMRRRIALQQNALYPKTVQVDCRRPDCVGLGYLGFDTVMCFLCEEQWPANEGASAISEELPGTVKACPRCQAPIEKNGGCDHMTCRCTHEFYWTTLVPYKRDGG